MTKGFGIGLWVRAPFGPFVLSRLGFRLKRSRFTKRKRRQFEQQGRVVSVSLQPLDKGDKGYSGFRLRVMSPFGPIRVFAVGL